MRGQQGDGHLLEIYAAKTGDSWTVVVTDPSGESCIMSEGIELELVRPFPAIGPLMRVAYRELDIAATGTPEQAHVLGDPRLLPRPWDQIGRAHV